MGHANISIFVPHLGCPRQCSFCEQNTITGRRQAPPPGQADVLAAAELAARSLDDADRAQAEIAFFGGSFTAIDRAYMLNLLAAAREAVERYGFRGIRCSTRPDAVDGEVLDILLAHRVTAVELGAQSMDNGVLAANRRGHTAEDTRRAAGLIQSAGLELGLQMMTGLYQSTPEKDLATARAFVELHPATARIYPTIVLPGTELAELWRAGVYQPQTLEEAILLCARLLDILEGAGIRIIRVGLHASQEVEEKRLAGPYHPAFRQLAESERILQRLQRELSGPGAYQVEIHPKDISTALGQGRRNLARLEELGFWVRFVQAPGLRRGEFRIHRA